MNAIVVEGEALVWATVPEPEPGPGEVALRVFATAVNRADLLQRAGLYPPPAGASEILGLECSGTVLKVGAGVAGVAVGDPVCALLSGGGYAEVVVCPASHVLPVPAGFDLLAAAALPEAVATTYMTLRAVGRLQRAERVVVHAGASGIGSTMVQICRAWGNPCFVTVGTPEKLARCIAIGADAGFVRTEGQWAAAVREWAPDGVDVVVDPVGAGYVAQDLSVLRVDGRIVVIGLLGGTQATVDLGRLLVKRLSLLGTTLRSRSTEEKAALLAGVQAEIWPLVTANKVTPVIDEVFPITAAAAAHDKVAANRTIGKVVLSVQASRVSR